MNKSLVWRISVLLSVVIHIVVGSLFLFFPSEKKEKGTPFVTRLVSPDELRELPKKRDEGTSGKNQRPQSRPSLPAVKTRPSLPRQSAPPQPGKESRAILPQIPQQGVGKDQGDSGRGAPAAPEQGSIRSDAYRGGEGTPPPSSPRSGDMRRAPPAPSFTEKLFDREITERVAKREESKKENGITFETDEFRYHTYMVRLKEKIEGIWKYPPDAARRGIYGDLYIRFTIKKNGNLGEVELARTSGHRDLDEAALRALREAQPFWPLPDEWRKDALTITGHFVYSNYGAYIR